MADFVLDASVAMAWCFDDEAGEYADKVLEALSTVSALVPVIWPLEVGNVLVGAKRHDRLPAAMSARFVELIRELPIEVETTESGLALGPVLALAREQGLSTYDASYLELAMRAGLPLSTQEGALLRAAAACSVPHYLSD